MKATIQPTYHLFDCDRAAVVESLSAKSRVILSSMFQTRKTAESACRAAGFKLGCGWHISSATKPFIRQN